MRGKRFTVSLVIIICFTILSGIFRSAFADENDYSVNAIKGRIIKEAISQGFEPAVALSVAKQESGFSRSAKSHVGAIGLFQLMPETARNLGVNPYYIDQNIKGGISYLKSLKDQFGSTKLALAAYNAGPGAVNRYGGIPPYSETRNYVRNIMYFYSNYQANPDPILVSFYNSVKDNPIVKAVDEQQSNEQPVDVSMNQPQSMEKAPTLSFFTRVWQFLS